MNIKIPMNTRKRLTLKKGTSDFVLFEYEKLTLFFFLCGKLGHGERYCPIRAVNLTIDLEFKLDILLRAQPRRTTASKSRWKEGL